MAVPKTLSGYILTQMKPQMMVFIAIQCCALAWSLDNTIWPFLLQKVIDHLTLFDGNKAEFWSYIMPFIIIGVTMWVVIDAMFRIQGFIAAKAMPKLEARIRKDFFAYVNQHSYNYFAEHFAGSIANKINDMPSSTTHMLQLLINLFIPALVALLIAMLFFFPLQPLYAIVMFVWVIIHMGICFIHAGKMDRLSHIHAESRSSLSGKIVDSLTNNIQVKLFARTHYEQQIVDKAQEEELSNQTTSLWYTEIVRLYTAIACFLFVGIAMHGLMLYGWLHEWITMGQFVMIFSITWHITILAWLSGMELPNFFKEMGVCRQAMTLLQTSHEIADSNDATLLDVSNGEIRFEAVDFCYQPEKRLFEGKDVTIHAREKVGLVGYSGSGKTSFVHLILRFFTPQKGRILIDGQDIMTVTQDSLRSQIAMIPQDPSLFHRSLMENIRYGNMNASNQEVIAASKAASCHEFITKLPEGYDALVGERGVKLSGGQRQRIAIARAIVKNAPILILDEATSALDSVTENSIQTALMSAFRDKTTIVIAHRLSTLKHMDRILVFDQGNIVESGTHEALLAQKGHYFTLWQQQSFGFLP